MPAQRSCLVVIARDEAPRIERLLRSVSPWVDEMLVLDTGSADATVAVARACGARTAHFAWCDDFAVARNAALALAAADWHVVLDADEWLIDGGAALADLRRQPADFVGVLQRLDQDAAAGLVQDWISRVLPGSVRYTGRVHEQPQHALPTRRLAIRIGHDGYNTVNRAAKRGRNRALLQLELARWPGDAGLWFTLGNDHSAYDEPAQAAAAYARAEALRPADSPWRRELAARHLYALKRAGRHAEGLACAEARMADCADSPDFFFALGDLLLDWAAEDPSQGATALPLAEAAWLRCLELGERPDQPGSVQGRGSHLAAHNLAVVYEGLGNTEQARALRERHPPPMR